MSIIPKLPYTNGDLNIYVSAVNNPEAGIITQIRAFWAIGEMYVSRTREGSPEHTYIQHNQQPILNLARTLWEAIPSIDVDQRNDSQRLLYDAVEYLLNGENVLVFTLFVTSTGQPLAEEVAEYICNNLVESSHQRAIETIKAILANHDRVQFALTMLAAIFVKNLHTTNILPILKWLRADQPMEVQETLLQDLARIYKGDPAPANVAGFLHGLLASQEQTDEFRDLIDTFLGNLEEKTRT